MGSIRGKGYLGDLNKRLQTFFGFEGEAGGDFDTIAKPVLLIGDATLPGYGDRNQRRWAAGFDVPAGQSMFVRARQDVIIEKIQVQRSAVTFSEAIALTLWQYPPTSTKIMPALSIQRGQFLDRCISFDERGVDVQVAAGTVVGAGAIQLNAAVIPFSTEAGSSAPQGFADLLPIPFCLQQTNELQVTNGGAVDALFVTFWGRPL